MMNFPVHTPESAPAASKEILQDVTNAYGFLPNLYAVMAEAPMAPVTYFELSKIFDRTSLSAAEQQVVLLTTSYLNECTYCIAAHTVVAKMKQVPEEIIQSIRNEQPLSDPKLEALRQFTVSVVESRGWPSQQAQDYFAEAGYGSAQALEVMIGISIKTFSNYINHLANTPLDDAFASGAWEKPQAT